MDIRKWLLMQERPDPSDSALTALIWPIPHSDYRSPSVLELFLAGFHTDFRLTDAYGVPTEALHLMAKLMEVQLCPASQLPPEEQQAFLSDSGGTLLSVLSPTWYLRGLTARVKSAWSMSGWTNQWVHLFLPGLHGSYITYKDPDGKRRKRVCYVAVCKPDWRLSDDVYEGIWRWTYERHGPPSEHSRSFWAQPKWPDAYTLLRTNPTLRSRGGSVGRSNQATELCSPAPERLPPAYVSAQEGTAG